MAQLIKPQIKWTEGKINLLKQEYPLGDKEKLAKILGINRKTLKSAARRFGIKSKLDQNHYKLKILYEESLISYYWMGFIIADGNIEPKVGQLRIALSIKDFEHLKKIANLLKINIHKYKMKTQFSNKILEYCRIACTDSKYGKLLIKKFNLSNLPKTYNPPSNLEFKNNSLFLAFLIGMIDGDGAFSNYHNNCDFIRIELHKSWLNILSSIKEKLNNIGMEGVSIGINKREYCFLKIHRHQNLKFIKEFGLTNKLPILERKWNYVNENRILKKAGKTTTLNL